MEQNLRVEQNAQAGTHSTAGSHNGEGPAGGEFYFADAFRWQNETMHAETGAGGLALWHNGPQTRLLHSSHEPTAEFNNAGFSIFDAQTGESQGGVALYRNMQLGYFAKANGVGDIELVSEAVPITVGSQLWWDTNQNGLFDPEELPMGGTTLELYAGSELIGSTQTNQAGEYWFDFQNVAGGLHAQIEYEIRLGNRQQGHSPLKPSTGTLTQQGTALSQNDVEVRLRFRTGDAGETLDALNLGFEAVTTKTATEPTLLAVNEGNAELVVYPNPLTRDAQVRLTNNAQAERLQVIDLSGRVLHEQKMSGNSTTIQASRLPIGKFILRVQTDKGVFSKGVVKE